MKPAKVVFFLGAGATKYLGIPDTADFLRVIESTASSPDPYIKKFTSDSKYIEIYYKIRQYYLDTYDVVDVEDIYTKVIDFWNDIARIVKVLCSEQDYAR